MSLTESDFSIYVLDDDAAARRATTVMMAELTACRIIALNSAKTFLESYDRRPSILVCEFRRPSMSGVDLAKEIAGRNWYVPMVLITAFPSIPFVVEALKVGIVSILQKPFSTDQLWLAIRETISNFERDAKRQEARFEAHNWLALLTQGEREVLDLVVSGRPNKSIACQLDVSTRTVEARRRRILDKAGAESLAEVIRMFVIAEFDAKD